MAGGRPSVQMVPGPRSRTGDSFTCGFGHASPLDNLQVRREGDSFPVECQGESFGSAVETYRRRFRS